MVGANIVAWSCWRVVSTIGDDIPGWMRDLLEEKLERKIGISLDKKYNDN